jgi:2-polyprenyl-3-methyl-5-hydroxy-6-metoxy-1,4-benzoquinol methylase
MAFYPGGRSFELFGARLLRSCFVVFLLGLRLDTNLPHVAAEVVRAELKAFWEEADPTFSHIAYDKWLESEAALVSEWRNRWLGTLRKSVKLKGLRVAEYGIGGGLLGETLIRKYGVSHYQGYDIALRQCKTAEERLSKFPSDQWAVTRVDELPNVDNTADLFVSQAVMQHFPSQEYTERFLARLNGSGIGWCSILAMNFTSSYFLK